MPKPKLRKSPQPQRELTTREVADLLKVTPSRVRNMVSGDNPVLTPVRSLSGSTRANYQNFFAEADVLRLVKTVTANPMTALGREQDHPDETLDLLRRLCKHGRDIVVSRDAEKFGCHPAILAKRLKRLEEAGLATSEKRGRERPFRPV